MMPGSDSIGEQAAECEMPSENKLKKPPPRKAGLSPPPPKRSLPLCWQTVAGEHNRYRYETTSLDAMNASLVGISIASAIWSGLHPRWQPDRSAWTAWFTRRIRPSETAFGKPCPKKIGQTSTRLTLLTTASPWTALSATPCSLPTSSSHLRHGLDELSERYARLGNHYLRIAVRQSCAKQIGFCRCRHRAGDRTRRPRRRFPPLTPRSAPARKWTKTAWNVWRNGAARRAGIAWNGTQRRANRPRRTRPPQSAELGAELMEARTKSLCRRRPANQPQPAQQQLQRNQVRTKWASPPKAWKPPARHFPTTKPCLNSLAPEHPLH